MKNIITMLLILVSTNSFSNEGFGVRKSLCETNNDVITHRFQAHSIKSLKVEVSEDSLLIDMQSVMLSCLKKEEGYQFEERGLYADFEYQIFSSFDEDGNAILKTITASTNTAKLIIFKDKNYTKVATIDIQPSSALITSLSEEITLDKLLSESELADYNNGKEVKKDIDLYLVRNLDLNATDFTLKHNSSYQFRTINLTISK